MDSARHDIKVTDSRMLFFFTSTILIFALLAFRSEVNRRASDRNRETIIRNAHTQAVFNWAQCERQAANTVKIAARDAALVDFLTSQLPAATHPDNLRKVIAIYRGAELVPPVCGPEP